MVEIKKIMKFSQLIASKKRVLLLLILMDGPLSYTQIVRKSKELGMSMASSEFFKHKNVLLKNGLISKKWNLYAITAKGVELINKLKEIAKTEPIEPEITIKFVL